MTSCAVSSPELAPTPLLEKARTRGVVLVIVTLRVPAAATPAEIQAVKQSVIAAIAPTRHRVVRELGGLPQLVLEASEETLRVLAGSSDVVRIDESVPQPPLR
jgi:hypothetical protein